MWYATQNWNLVGGSRSILRKIGQFLAPGTCALCDSHVANGSGCCADCWRELCFISKPYCPVLGTPFSVDMGADFLCADAIASPPPFERLRGAVLYNASARKLVSNLKYGDRLDLAPLIARWMKHAGGELVASADMIVPVPLHNARLRQRRFNQSCELARYVAKHSSVSSKPHILRRKKATRQQVGLNERERQKNVSGAFMVPPEHAFEVHGQRILLIDDVYTTGATSKSATRALMRAGASAVDVLVFAMVETETDLTI